MLLRNCPIINSDAEVIDVWCIADDTPGNASPYSSNSMYNHSGVDLKRFTIKSKSDINEVFSICYGSVVAVNFDLDGFVVTVQYDSEKCVRYCNLLSVYVTIGQAVKYGDKIGIYRDYVHFEYAISTESDSSWAVRIGDLTYYKADPMPVLQNRYLYLYDYREDEPEEDFSNLPDAELNKITNAVLSEFRGGRGR